MNNDFPAMSCHENFQLPIRSIQREAILLPTRKTQIAAYGFAEYSMAPESGNSHTSVAIVKF